MMTSRTSTAMAIDDSSQVKQGATWKPQPSRDSTPMMSSVMAAGTPAEIDSGTCGRQPRTQPTTTWLP